MNKTNKATTTTMVRRASAALLAVCITALHLVMPVKAATRPMVTADGYYPGTGANPQRYYYCAISGTDTSFTSEMYYALDGHKIPSSYGSGSFYMDVMSKYYLNLTTYVAKLNF